MRTNLGTSTRTSSHGSLSTQSATASGKAQDSSQDRGGVVVMYNAPARTIVRRLTPLECERLMGWPDDYTLHGITDEGELVDIANTNRYRICGNGIVATVTEWIGKRLAEIPTDSSSSGASK